MQLLRQLLGKLVGAAVAALDKGRLAEGAVGVAPRRDVVRGLMVELAERVAAADDARSHSLEARGSSDAAKAWSWASAAGVTGGRVNRFNIVKQSKDYDPSGEYVRHWVPELAAIPGATVEDNKFSMSVHWRNVAEEQRGEVAVRQREEEVRALKLELAELERQAEEIDSSDDD